MWKGAGVNRSIGFGLYGIGLKGIWGFHGEAMEFWVLVCRQWVFDFYDVQPLEIWRRVGRTKVLGF